MLNVGFSLTPEPIWLSYIVEILIVLDKVITIFGEDTFILPREIAYRKKNCPPQKLFKSVGLTPPYPSFPQVPLESVQI